MKTLLLSAFSLTTVLAQAVHAAQAPDQDQAKPAKKQQQKPTYRQAPVPQTPRVQPNPNARQTPVQPKPYVRQTPVYRPPQINPVQTKPAPYVRPLPDQDAVRRRHQSPGVTPYVRPNPNLVTPPTTVQPNNNPRNRSDWDNRNRNRDRDNNDWRNRTHHNNNSWEYARRRHYRTHHHRDWWRSRYTRFALFGAGYYFWDSGYWFPAYGYDPAYNTYAYTEPIYGYNDLEPAQVIANVQTELQRLGYYRYAVDGEMGPATRAAIANYQRDTGLAITSAIDEPTLQSLGLE
jgi:hypothetical protein